VNGSPREDAPRPGKVARVGRGHFQWSPGGYFGAQLGGTLWLLSFLWFAPLAPEAAGLGLGLFAAANAVGFALWWGRDRIAPYVGVQLLLLACAAAGVAAFAGLTALRPSLASRLLKSPRDWMPLLVFPAIMVAFHLMEASARRARARAVGAGPGTR
jgi:hypothetical protein